MDNNIDNIDNIDNMNYYTKLTKDYIHNLHININHVKYTFFAFIVIMFLFFSIVIFIIFSYCVLKLLKLNIDDHNFLFYKYNKKSQRILDLYGDCELTKIYLVRQSFSKLTTFILNIFTLYNYDKLIYESQCNFPYHISLVFEIKLPNNKNKFLMLEKNNSINLCDNFSINNTQEMKMIKIKKNKYTINSILKITKDRVGIEKFFNWHIHKNNCTNFIKEILISINQYNKICKKFIFHDNIDKVVQTIIPTEFNLHIVNSCINIKNKIEEYIYDSSFL